MEFKEEKQRIVLIDEGKEIGEITYQTAKEKEYIVDHTFVDDQYRGQGLAAQLVEKMVKKARKDGAKIDPHCPYVKQEFEQKSDYQDVWLD